MVTLRIFGLVVSLVALYLFYRYYREEQNKTAFLAGLIFAVSLGAVSLFPDTFNVFFHFFTSTRALYYRINVLLIFSVIFLSILQISTLFTTSFHERTLVEMNHRQGIKDFEREYSKDVIKPIQIVIPAYNEEKGLAELLPKIPRTIEGKEVGVLVVSDGSQDDTLQIARSTGNPAIETIANLGQGSALSLGFAVASRKGAEIIVSMDADGQHQPDDLNVLITPLLNDEADLTIGSRRLPESVELSTTRRLGIYVFNGLMSLLLRTRVTDCSNGFRAFRSEVFQNLTLEERQYQATEFLIKALGNGVRLKEVPVTVHARSHGRTKKGPDFVYGWNFFKVILNTWWQR